MRAPRPLLALRGPLLLLLAALLPSPDRAGTAPGHPWAPRGAWAEAPAAGPAVEALPVDRGPLAGTLRSLSAETLTLTGAAGETVSLPVAGLRDLRFTAPEPAGPPGERLRATLAGGEEVLAESYEPAPDGLLLRGRTFGALQVPFELLLALVPLPPRASPCHDPLGRLGHAPGSDHVHLVGGDEVHGTLLDAGAQGLRVETERDRVRTVAWSDVLLATLDNPVARPPEGPTVEVETTAGDRLLLGGPLTLAEGALRGALASDPRLTVAVPVGLARQVRWRAGRCVDATRLPFTARYTPLVPPPPGSLAEAFLARDRGCRVDRRPRGCPLRLGGTTYAHGFAVHSGSEVRLPLAGRFRRFEALAGVDDEALEEARGRDVPAGDVDLQVLGDGRVLWEAKGVRGGAPAQRVGPVDVSGVKELVLVVGYGAHDEILDRVTWADPVLLP